jgi:hypothetical protein
MLKIKKVLSVALVVLMLLSTVAIGAYAIPADGKEVGLVLVSDKKEEEIVPGSKVTVTFYYDMRDYNQLMSEMKLFLFYDASVYTPDPATRTWIGDLADFAKNSTIAVISPSQLNDAVKAKATLTEEEKASFTDSLMVTVAADAALPNHNTAKKGFKVTEGENGLSVAEFSVVFNVTGDEAALAKGNKNIKILDVLDKGTQYIKKTTGSAVPKLVSGIDVTKGNIMANMPSAPSYTVAKYKTQVKFTGDKTTAPDDFFQFRLTSVITAADFAAMNSNGNTIKSVGFIAANTGAADADAAKTAVEKGTALPSAWKTASTDYVSQANASSDAYFGAIVKNISHASQATDIDCIAYVCYNDGTADHYVWYSAAVTAKVASGYDAAVAAWKAQ